jgi:hypothetical protein
VITPEIVEMAAAAVAPSVRQSGWAAGAVEVYVRDRLPELRARAMADGLRGRDEGRFVYDRLISGILNESFGP